MSTTRLVPFLASAAVAAAVAVTVPSTSTVQPTNFFAYVSLSIELGSFPLFAGNLSSPNEFSVNLLSNIASFQGGVMPAIRVGGNSQDRAIYDPTLETPTASRCSADPLAIQCIGPSFFDSYRTFPGALYGHGFNLAANNDSGYSTLQQTVPLACKAIGAQGLNVWEYGNEPDLYRGKWRPSNWSVSEYVDEWLNGTAHIATYLQEACPDMAPPKFMAPSFSSAGSALSQTGAWQDGLDSQQAVVQFSSHNYITGATSPGVTLQGTLMNHNVTVRSVNSHANAAKSLAGVGDTSAAPYILGECNSLYGGGAAGLSDVFGAALWVMDFTLYAASTGAVHRLHYHQSNGSPYSAWSPVSSGGNQPATNTPYYGKLAAARFLGASNETAVVEVPLSSSPYESAYAAYGLDGRLARLAVLNMNQYNSTSTAARPVATYNFTISGEQSGSTWSIERLVAPGSDVKTGVTFGGYAYEYFTLGKGKKIDCVPSGETATVGEDGVLSVGVSDSSAVVLSPVQ